MVDVYLSRNLAGQRVLATCEGGRIVAVIRESETTKPEHLRHLAESLGYKLVYQIGMPLITVD